MEKLNLPQKYIDYLNTIIPGGYNDLISLENKVIADKVMKAYRDCLSYDGTEKLFMFLIYQIVRNYYNLDKVPNEYAFKYIQIVLDNKKIKEKILSSEPESEFYSVLKSVIPKYEKLIKAMLENKNYEATILFSELFDFLKNEALDFVILTPEELETECQKRYFYPYDTVEHYMGRMKKKKYKFNKEFQLTDFPKIDFYSSTSGLMTTYLKKILLRFYEHTGYIYRPLPNGAKFYKFGSIGLIGYPSLESISINALDQGQIYNISSYEFWAIINSKSNIPYIVDDSSLKSFVSYEGPLLVAPIQHRDAAFYEYSKHELGGASTLNLEEKLASIGFRQPASESTIITNDYRTFFIDPQNPDSLVVEDLSKYETLSKIKDKDEKERKTYIKRLIAKYKGQQSLTSKAQPKPYQYQHSHLDQSVQNEINLNPKAWWKND